MASWDAIPDDMRAFIEAQIVFFVATAPMQGRVNLSPKGLDTLRVLDDRTVAYLDLTGSGNETAAHVTDNGRMTMLFCSFGETPLTLRLYGKADLIRPHHPDWGAMRPYFPDLPGARQIFRLHVESVATSCGWGVPMSHDLRGRDDLVTWVAPKTGEQMENYRRKFNVASIDGLPTGYLPD
jgi:hypothetical protein